MAGPDGGLILTVVLAIVPALSRPCFGRLWKYAKAVFNQTHFVRICVKIELADDGRPAPAAHLGDCCGLPSPHSVAGGARTAEH